MLDVHAIAAFNDNYIWLIKAQHSHQVIIVDPGDAAPVLDYLSTHALQPVAIFITHHHHDHIGGVEMLLQHYPVLPVYGPATENIGCITHAVKGDSLMTVAGFPVFEILETPGHTAGHICYYTEKQLFCGDTLFAAGCGRVFDGSVEQLYASLQQLKSLPEETLIYCAHEYTEANLKFAIAVEPDNAALQQRIEKVEAIRAADIPSVPSRLAEELATNPFLRTDQAAIKKAAETFLSRPVDNALDTFTAIRQWKDQF